VTKVKMVICNPEQEEILRAALDTFPDVEVEVLTSNFIDLNTAYVFMDHGLESIDLTIVPFAPPDEMV
jgi:hypothetical protein